MAPMFASPTLHEQILGELVFAVAYVTYLGEILLFCLRDLDFLLGEVYGVEEQMADWFGFWGSFQAEGSEFLVLLVLEILSLLLFTTQHQYLLIHIHKAHQPGRPILQTNRRNRLQIPILIQIISHNLLHTFFISCLEKQQI